MSITSRTARARSVVERTRRQIAEEILTDAEATDTANYKLFGASAGPGLPQKWSDTGDRGPSSLG